MGFRLSELRFRIWSELWDLGLRAFGVSALQPLIVISIEATALQFLGIHKASKLSLNPCINARGQKKSICSVLMKVFDTCPSLAPLPRRPLHYPPLSWIDIESFVEPFDEPDPMRYLYTKTHSGSNISRF